MEEIQHLLGGFAVAMSWFNLMLMLAGITLGVISSASPFPPLRYYLAFLLL